MNDVEVFKWIFMCEWLVWKVVEGFFEEKSCEFYVVNEEFWVVVDEFLE